MHADNAWCKITIDLLARKEHRVGYLRTRHSNELFSICNPETTKMVGRVSKL